EGELELVYLLNSYLREDEEYGEREKESIIMKTRIPRKNPQIGTSIHVFDNAEPYERELHEMFGISFDGHPRQTPLFLEKEYEIPPFRKDFDTREYVEKEIEPIPAVED
ncbi:MAG: NADH-quinone oxidoreductase subunit C, partial [Candidatus Bipolaricaulota bacterium]